jgi:hypothetical protein
MLVTGAFAKYLAIITPIIETPPATLTKKFATEL